MKVLIAGSWGWLQYEQAFADALSKLGHEAIKCSFSRFFEGRLGHYQNVLPAPGPALLKLNAFLLEMTERTKPQIVLVWRGTHVLPVTIEKIKATGATVVSYNNDDPFGPLVHKKAPWHHSFLWRWYWKSLKHCDFTFVNRPINVAEALSFGAKNVNVMKPYFIPERHRPVVLSQAEKERFLCDIVFVGHYEADGREQYLKALVNAGLHVRLFGGGYWTEQVLGDMSQYFGPVSPVHGEDYVRALCGAKICLSFLSKLNRDTYTRRCFEIPACGGLLLCERTADLQAMFKEGEEAVFFSSKEELAEKAKRLVSNPGEIRQIAEAGMRRVWKDGHDVTSRARQFMDMVTGTGKRS